MNNDSNRKPAPTASSHLRLVVSDGVNLYRYGTDELYQAGLAPVIIRFGRWAVTTAGVERVDGGRLIPNENLQNDWQWLIEQEREASFDGPGDALGLQACLEFARISQRRGNGNPSPDLAGFLDTVEGRKAEDDPF